MKNKLSAYGFDDIFSKETFYVMDEMSYASFVHNHIDEIVAKIHELDNFSESDIAMLKTQIVRGIAIRKKMPVVPINEIRQLLVGYIAIRFIEEQLDFEF
ncbi:MAG: hypothetical protein N2316_08710 [Spirochaetes bacterium]|nr:hypothetical protein [Spirochaetota bacterium]